MSTDTSRTSGTAGDGDGITAFLVPSDAPGFEVLEYLWTFNMPTDHAHIRLTDVRVPHANLIGQVNAGWGPMMSEVAFFVKDVVGPRGAVSIVPAPSENKDQLVAVLSYHVLGRKLTANMLPGRAIHVRTIKGSGDRVLRIEKSTSGVTVDDANVISADIMVDNGVIHVIDKVMLPSN